MAEFEPIAIAREVRRNRLFAPGPDDLPGFGPQGAWQAGSAALEKVVAGWWVAESEPMEEVLATAARWFELPAERAVPYGDDPLFWEARHRERRALCGWMTGRDSRESWSAAARLQDALLRRGPDRAGSQAPLSLAVASAMAGEPQPAAADFAEGLDSELCRLLAGDPRRREAAAAFGSHLRRHGARLFADWPGVPEAALFAHIFHRGGLIERRPDCLTCCYALIPGLALPPALGKRGWSDSRSGRIRLGPSLRFERLDRLLLALGFTRDADSTPQPESPGFASWTRQPGLESEADWHCDGDLAWLELRGEDSGRVAALVAETFGGRAAEDDAGALADLLTVPPAARSGGNASVRWEILATLLRAAPEVERLAAEPLVEAGLRDPDWRVRMTAVWGVGALGIGRLADAAGSAPLPAVDYEGLGAEDRHTLLALRDAARDRASGRNPPPPDRDGGGPGGSARAAFVARIGGLLDGLAPPARDRNEALLMALLGMPDPGLDRIPRAWKAWMA